MNSMNTKRKQLQDGKNLWMNCFWRICREERNEWPSFHHSSCFSFFSISFSFFLCGKRWQAQGPSRHGTDGWRALPPVPRVPNDVVVWPFGGRRNRSGSLRRQLRRSPLKKNNNNQKKKQSVWCGRVFFLFFFFSVYFYLFNFFFVVVTFPGRRPPKALCSGARKRGEKRRAFGRHRTQYLSPNPRISLFPPTNTTATTTTSSSSSLFSFFFFFYFFWYSCAKVEVGRRRFDFFCVPSAQ